MPVEEIQSEEEVLLTAWLRPSADRCLNAAQACEIGQTPPAARVYADREPLEISTAASETDVEKLQEYCESHGIEVVEKHWRSVVLRGRIKRLIDAFGASVSTFEDSSGYRFRHRDGSLHAPPEIARTLYAVFGFHQWPRSHRLGGLQRHATPLQASEVAQRYAFPPAAGRGQVIAILQLHGEFFEEDFTQCMKAQSIAAQLPRVKRIDDTALTHKVETVKDLEAALDVQIAAALAPEAQIVVYQAPNNERGVLDGLRTAIFDKELRPAIISISYGWPEPLWTPAALDVMNELFVAAALLGITVFCASGDNGAELTLDGKPHVIAPASTPFAHSCGATQIQAGTQNEGEIAWDKTGGGFSEHFETPPWQDCARHAAVQLGVAPGRGVPDVAGQESPGYLVYLNGTELAAGGTSAVAPMWSALAARLNERLGRSIGFFAPLLYRSDPPMHAVVEGGNGRYCAQSGWNPCAGLGTPDGTALESLLRG